MAGLFLLSVGLLLLLFFFASATHHISSEKKKFNPARVDITALAFLLASNTVVKGELDLWNKILAKSYLTSMKQTHFHKRGSRIVCVSNFVKKT